MNFRRTAQFVTRTTAALILVVGAGAALSGLEGPARAWAEESPEAPAPVEAGKTLTADDCVQIALRRSYAIRQSEDRLNQARAGKLQSWGPFIPSLSLNAQYSHQKTTSDFEIEGFGAGSISNSTSSKGYGYTLGQQILSVPAMLNIIAQKRTVGASEADLRASEEEVAFAVRQQFFKVIEARKLLTVSVEDFRLANEEQKRTEALFSVGSVARTDVLKAKVRVANAQSSLTAAQNDAQLQEAQLAVDLALPVDQHFALDDGLEARSDAVDSTAAYTEAIRNRPELAAARLRVQAARAGRKAAYAGKLPTISHSYSKDFVPWYDRDFYDNSYNLLGHGRVKPTTGTYSIQLNWSILDHLVTEGNIVQNRAIEMSAQHALSEQELAVQLDVKASLVSLRNASAQMQSAREAVVSAEEDLKLSQERYNVGLGTILELIDARVALTRARTAEVQAMAAVKIAEAALDKATGHRNW